MRYKFGKYTIFYARQSCKKKKDVLLLYRIIVKYSKYKVKDYLSQM